LRRIQAPYPLPTPCVDIALSALTTQAQSRTHEFVALIRRERDRVAQALAARTRVLPSVANFLCVRFADGAATYRYLLSQDIVVRNVGGYPGLRDCLRISIGTPDENDRLLRALASSALAA
jgi:histidinol-phosphate aminotransferase